MTIEELLKAEGYTDEESQALITNPKYAGTLKKLVDNAENGQTALLKAQELETNIRKFNDETVIPYGAKKDQEAALARAESAKYQTYLKTLKDQGYEIPDAYLSAAPEPEKKEVSAVDGRYVAKDDLDKQGDAYMRVVSISNRYRKLTGDELDVSEDYEKFKTERRPNERFGDYIDRKYDLGALQTKRDDEKREAEAERFRKEGEERYAKAHPRSENEELRTPAATKFDKFQKLPDEKKNSWQTREGREASTIARQEKYKSLLVQ